MKKKSLRFYVTIFLARMATVALRLTGHKATHFPGLLSNTLCPDFLGQIEKPKTIIGVTGTNGKTTVCNLIGDVLKKNGYEFVSNSEGANLSEGIVTALLANSTFWGKPKKDLAVLEIDERYSPRIYPYLQPDILACTNLFRDSYKRNAHSEYISGILNRVIPDKTRLVLNGDDLISNHLKPDNERVYFGIEWQEGEVSVTDNIINDMVVCPECDSPLNYEFIRYNHIGRAHCSRCGFGSPKVDYDVVRVDKKNARMTMINKGQEEVYHMVGTSITDIYNMSTTVAVLKEFGLDAEAIDKGFAKGRIVKSRFNAMKVGGKELIFTLAKGQNPIACSRVFDYIRQQKGRKAVLLVIDDWFDAKDSSENIAWIYQADYEFLNRDDVKAVCSAGPRYLDYKVRMLLAGIDEEKIHVQKDWINAADLITDEFIPETDKIFVLYDVATMHLVKKIRGDLTAKLKGGKKK